LHYLNEKNNKKFLSNVCDSTKHSFLLENFTINEKDKNKWQRLSKLLKKEFEIDRHYYTVKQIREMLIEDNLWKIKKEYSWIKKDLDFLKFVKSRFKVKQEAIDKYFKSKKNLIKRHPTKIFWCSKAH
jgi:hypothetical protein